MNTNCFLKKKENQKNNSKHFPTIFVSTSTNLNEFIKSLNDSMKLGAFERPKENAEKNPLEAEWLHFDDTKVKSLSNTEFQRKIIDSNYDSPYILFYVKESI
ncbi:hypothetical protein BpHYR1_006481 [Brachionus plicatilis]|uniref:Uncharacterized protein n=1 Tax=Brachionus plicatilis TaxID=10195 RepID=A0A3M7RHE9_BRAPC|nr:hypothetical protein BpHYR1_006481 [Brachionus plicatilis]